jgi:hypothetical protein
MEVVMSEWDVTNYAAKDNLLRVLRREADALMFIVWQVTTEVPPDMEPFSVGVRVTGRNAGDYLVSISGEGLSYAREDVSALPAVLEFDAGSLVLTAFGRVNAGTIRGDRAVADQFLNSFFRI